MNTQKKHPGDTAGVVFYDMTKLYFEASDGDDLRKTGFSKDRKPHCPQIMTGLLAGHGGYLSGYDIYECNTYEEDTLISFIKKINERFPPGKPIVIAPKTGQKKTDTIGKKV